MYTIFEFYLPIVTYNKINLYVIKTNTQYTIVRIRISNCLKFKSGTDTDTECSFRFSSRISTKENAYK